MSHSPEVKKSKLAQCNQLCGGDVVLGIVLYRICYWTPHAKIKINEGAPYFAKSAKEMAGEICTTRRVVQHSYLRLSRKRLIEVEKRMFNGHPTTHLRLSATAYEALFPLHKGVQSIAHEGEIHCTQGANYIEHGCAIHNTKIHKKGQQEGTTVADAKSLLGQVDYSWGKMLSLKPNFTSVRQVWKKAWAERYGYPVEDIPVKYAQFAKAIIAKDKDALRTIRDFVLHYDKIRQDEWGKRPSLYVLAKNHDILKKELAKKQASTTTWDKMFDE